MYSENQSSLFGDKRILGKNCFPVTPGMLVLKSLGAITGYYICFPAWAMVDGGANVKARTSYNEKTPRIVVSRSHSGMVKQVALQTFGNQTTIIPAGGAGMFLLRVGPTLCPAWPCPRQEAHWYPVLGKKWEWTLGLLGQAWSPTWLFRERDFGHTCLLGTVSQWKQSHSSGFWSWNICRSFPDTSGCCMWSDFEVIVLLV